MKLIILTKRLNLSLLLILFFQLVFSQIPFVENTTWGTSERIEKDFEEIKIYALSPGIMLHPAISFKSNNQFVSFNSPNCGLDCVVHVSGNYKTKDSTIQFTINSISRTKACHGFEKMNKNIGTYFLVNNEYGMRLVKTLDDEPKENYFIKQKIETPIFDDEIAKNLIKKYEYIFNKTSQIVKNKNKKKYDILSQDLSEWRYEALTFSNSVNNDKHNNFRLLTIAFCEKIEGLLKLIK